MIRTFEQRDMESILDIWLSASIQAHDFIDASYWQSHVEAMRDVYIPASETYVLEDQSRLMGFCCLVGDQIAALFVDPGHQGKGLGKQLLEHAKKRRDELTLAVYKENAPSLAFYRSQGFVVVKEQVDEQTDRGEYLMAWIKR
ncbi:N-acetyltransferase [Pseudomonas chlororaphis]|uniref:N-acetyltransferase n=1 Tax=Pseudomonas chlororaphis TaxID=587753 RepID=A0A1Q8ER69_9PSED|nr:N-acetyltransferase [Pseudomonas chlororaphis]OLF54291.1 N-acetyltransferase [Pseudomonas chlororaphis]